MFLKARADEIGVAPKLIGSAADIEALAGEDNPDLALLRGWRREVFGDDALRIRDGQLALAARPGGVSAGVPRPRRLHAAARGPPEERRLHASIERVDPDATGTAQGG